MNPIFLFVLVQLALVAAQTTKPPPAGAVLDMASNKRQKALEHYPWGSSMPNMFKRSIRMEPQSDYGINTENVFEGFVQCVDESAYECSQLARKGGCERSRLVQSKCPVSCKLC